MKHFAVKNELYEKVVNYLNEKEIRFSISGWVEKACTDLIEKENRILEYHNYPVNEERT